MELKTAQLDRAKNRKACGMLGSHDKLILRRWCGHRAGAIAQLLPVALLSSVQASSTGTLKKY